MGKDEQKGIDQVPVTDEPEQLAAGLGPDEVVDSLKAMREAPDDGTSEAGEAKTVD